MTPPDRRQQPRREGDPVLKALKEQVDGFRQFMERTEKSLSNISESLRTLAEVKAGQEYTHKTQDATLLAVGQMNEKINDLYGRSQRAHGRIDVLDAKVENHHFWLRLIGVTAFLGLLGTAGTALIWALGKIAAGG